jgi:hypothetical protein
LRALRHTLRPDSYWVISVPNVAHWSVRKELLQGRFDLTDTGVMDRTHLRWFTVRSLREMIEGAGYRVQRLEAAYTLPMQDALGLRSGAARLRKTRLWPALFGIQLVAQAGLAG